VDPTPPSDPIDTDSSRKGHHAPYPAQRPSKRSDILDSGATEDNLSVKAERVLVAGVIWWGLLWGCGPSEHTKKNNGDSDSVSEVHETVEARTFTDPAIEHPPRWTGTQTGTDTATAAIREVDPDIRLAYWLDITSDDPVTVAATWTDGDVGATLNRYLPATEHSLLILGTRPDRLVTVDITLTEADGATPEPLQLEFQTDTLPAGFPEFDVLSHDPAAVEPGHLMFPLYGAADNYLVILDEDLEVVWLHRGQWNDARVTEWGTLFGIRDQDVYEMRLSGEIVRHFSTDPSTSGTHVDLPGTFHHEAYPTLLGHFITLTDNTHRVDEYPISYEEPTVLDGPARIESAVVAVVGFDGTVESSFDLYHALDPLRIGYDSLDGAIQDWVHANAVIPHPDGGVIVSMRHQDAIVKFGVLGELKWILGSRPGWRAPWSDYTLQPVGGDLVWPYHQHAPQWLGVQGETVASMLVFDNHDAGNTLYMGVRRSRVQSGVIEYIIDEEAMTVEMVERWIDFGPESPITSDVYGDADHQAQTGNILATFGRVQNEGYSADNLAPAARVIEFHPSDPAQPVLDIRTSRNWKMDRAERVPSIR